MRLRRREDSLEDGHEVAVRWVVGFVEAVVLFAVLTVFLGSLLLRDRHHRSGVQRVSNRIGWVRARRTGAPIYRSGPWGRTPWGTFQLPGLAAPSRLSEWRDSYGRPFALLHVPATAHFTAVFATEPDGASLVDSEQVDSWVAHWGSWLASLGNEPGVVAASVTVETAPDSGTRLRREVEQHADEKSPAVAHAMLREVVEVHPERSATVKAWVALTFSATTRSDGRRRSVQEMGRELASRLSALGHDCTPRARARPGRSLPRSCAGWSGSPTTLRRHG